MFQQTLTTVKNRGRLSEALSPADGLETHELTALPSNIEAIESVMRFAEGAHDRVVLTGPSGWGKTHLLKVAADRVSRNRGGKISVHSALVWANEGSRPDTSDSLILDDVQDIVSQPRARHAFRQRLEHRVRTRKKTLVAWNSFEGSKAIRGILPEAQNWHSAQIKEPKTAERKLVAQQIASDNGLAISESIAILIAKHLNGNGRSMVGALQRLRLVKATWVDREDVIPACGVLSPYLLGQNGWDPRDHVHEAVQCVLDERSSKVRKSDLSAYFLLEEMGLCETEVAAFLRLTPGAVYSKARAIKDTMTDPDLESIVNACRNTVLFGFEGD